MRISAAQKIKNSVFGTFYRFDITSKLKEVTKKVSNQISKISKKLNQLNFHLKSRNVTVNTEDLTKLDVTYLCKKKPDMGSKTCNVTVNTEDLTKLVVSPDLFKEKSDMGSMKNRSTNLKKPIKSREKRRRKKALEKWNEKYKNNPKQPYHEALKGLEVANKEKENANSDDVDDSFFDDKDLESKVNDSKSSEKVSVSRMFQKLLLGVPSGKSMEKLLSSE